MQFSCSLFLRQWYHTRHKSLVLQSPQSFNTNRTSAKMRVIEISRIEQIFLFKKKVGNKYLTIVALIFSTNLAILWHAKCTVLELMRFSGYKPSSFLILDHFIYVTLPSDI